jgi:hypothetical protein
VFHAGPRFARSLLLEVATWSALLTAAAWWAETQEERARREARMVEVE